MYIIIYFKNNEKRCIFKITVAHTCIDIPIQVHYVTEILLLIQQNS